MKRKIEKKDILTIPNLLTMFRILLIPVIVVLYCEYHKYEATTLVILLSGVTDVADGFLARRFNMVSDLGKILDPIADKLTQATILLCLVTRFPHMIWLFVLMAVKETVMGITGILGIKYSGKVRGADWHGKLNTVLIYGMILTHVVWYNIPSKTSDLLLIIVAVMMIISLTLYSIKNIKVIKANK